MHKSQIIYQKSIYENKIFQACELQGRGGNQHMDISIAHVSRSWTIQIILQMFSLSFFTLSPDLYENLDSDGSDPDIQFYFLVQIKNACKNAKFAQKYHNIKR